LQPADQSDASTLPDPDLNPLNNPLLAANMGRWAEVYFTSPPEKRGEAVGQLLRELERESAKDANPTSGESREIEGEPAPRRLESAIAEVELPQLSFAAEDPVSACAACSYENAVGQKFCGMCGEPVPEPKPTAEEAEPEPVTSNSWSEAEPAMQEDYSSHAAAGDQHDEHRDETAGRSEFLRREENEPAWQMAEGDVPSFAVEAESVPYRYRLYIGALLAATLGVLVYMAWRGTTAFSGGQQSAASRAIPSAPAPEAAPEAVAPATTHGNEDVLPASANSTAPSASAASPSAPAATAKADRQPDSAAHVAPVSSPPTTSRSTAAPPKVEARRAPQVVARPLRHPIPATANSSAAAAELSGQEELATAERYLNGGPGAGREAAPWLWKAVAKGNLTATMTLSDLYLRGDGVPKSCDQARLLLDAAARKGSSAAGMRLRNLQAFGCR
jgi:hypothetical protein